MKILKKLAIAVIITASILQLEAYIAGSSSEYVKPAVQLVDLTPILEKAVLSDEDYEILYNQTGLTRLGVDRCMAKGAGGYERIKRIQRDLFADYEVVCDCFAPFCCAEKISANATLCYLENGDIIVTTSTRFGGYPIGHAGLVVNAASLQILQANSYFTKSSLCGAGGFTDRLNFMILSPVADEEVKNEVARYAKSNLTGINYGIFTHKGRCSRTQCAHLIWYAYSKFGIDIDGNGGFFVTPGNIINSNSVEVVQKFGFKL